MEISITIPSLERFLKDARPWGLEDRHPEGPWGGQTHDMQRTDPDRSGLLTLVGLRDTAKVLFVAGHKGTWPLALAEAGAEITYTDVSKSLTDFARENVRHPNIRDYICVNYVLCPEVPEQYEWTFTFEAVGPKPFILFRSLINRDGGKYVIWDKGDHAKRKLKDLTKAMELCRELYQSNGSIEEVQILARDREADEARLKHLIVTIRTNRSARERMFLDLRLFSFFYRRKKARLDEICVVMNCTSDELTQSMDRLSKWSSLFAEKYSKPKRLLLRHDKPVATPPAG